MIAALRSPYDTTYLHEFVTNSCGMSYAIVIQIFNSPPKPLLPKLGMEGRRVDTGMFVGRI
jgi:hypothetical protein